MASTEQEKKKARERALLNRAAKFYPELIDGKIDEGENPDFVVRQDDSCIGVELAEYVHKQNPKITSDRERERALRRLNEIVLERYAQRSDVPIYVATAWADSFHPKKQEMAKVADALIQAAIEQMPQGVNEGKSLDGDALRGHGVGEIVTSFFVLRLAAGGRSSWTTLGSGPSKVFPSEIQAIIDDKNPKVARYRLRCERSWLLIVAAGDDLASSAALYDDVRAHVFESAFDRILFVTLGDRTHAYLKLRLSG